MKTGIHPEYVETRVHCSCGNEFVTHSTRETLTAELCNECHPFYTGKQKLVDTGGRVERFRKRTEKADTKAVAAKKAKRSEKAATKVKESTAKPSTSAAKARVGGPGKPPRARRTEESAEKNTKAAKSEPAPEAAEETAVDDTPAEEAVAVQETAAE